MSRGLLGTLRRQLLPVPPLQKAFKVKVRRSASVPRKPSVFPAENVFERWDAAQLAAYPHELEQCRFVGCDFSGANLSNLMFIDCLFERCNLASATLANTALQNVAFSECKLSGLQFSVCRDMLFGVHFERCQLHYASFAGKRMPRTRFEHCALHDVDFTNTDLTEAALQECSLAGAVFEHTQLAGADFTTATNFIIDPTLNFLRKARFSTAGLPGLVSQLGIVIES